MLAAAAATLAVAVEPAGTERTGVGLRVAQALTAKVMGDANYLVNPCVIVCPFAGPKCQHGHFRMNGDCKPSQLYSHWQTVHKGNKAAKELEVRWRAAIKNKTLEIADLDVCAPCQMTGDEADGYEPLREAAVTTRHFPHSFAFGSAEYSAWLQATDEL